MIAWFKRRLARRVLINAGICPEHDIQRRLVPGRYPFYASCPECAKQENSAHEHKIAWARKILGLD